MDDTERSICILLEMGFSRPQAEKALNATGGNNIEAAMEWLLSNGNDENNGGAAAAVDPIDNAPDANENQEVANENKEEANDESKNAESQEAKSIVCDDCGKKFKSPVEVEFHAVKSGHQSFSESTDEVKPLSEEEKAEQKRKLEEKIKLRRKEKVEKERQESIEREKSRRRTGQEIASSKQKMEEMELKKIAEEKRKEKIEEKLARQRVKDQIERDKQARREKFNMGASKGNVSAGVSTEVQKSNTPAPKRDYDQCRLQLRLPDGKSLTNNFGSKELLAAVRLYVEMQRADKSYPFQLMTTFPKKVFTEDDMECTLADLGLTPSAVLIITKVQ